MNMSVCLCVQVPLESIMAAGRHGNRSKKLGAHILTNKQKEQMEMTGSFSYQSPAPVTYFL